MSLKYAILGLLNVKPMTGYELKHQAFDATVRHFWPADQSQIYRTLNQLAQEKWATATIKAQEERPDRKIYAITAAGQAALMAWLNSETAVPTLRDPLLVQLFFGQELPNANLLHLMQHQLAQHQQRLASLQQIPIPPANSRWLALQHLTRDFGLALEEAYIQWLTHCQAVIATLPDADEAADFRAPFS